MEEEQKKRCARCYRWKLLGSPCSNCAAYYKAWHEAHPEARQQEMAKRREARASLVVERRRVLAERAQHRALESAAKAEVYRQRLAGWRASKEEKKAARLERLRLWREAGARSKRQRLARLAVEKSILREIAEAQSVFSRARRATKSEEKARRLKVRNAKRLLNAALAQEVAERKRENEELRPFRWKEWRIKKRARRKKKLREAGPIPKGVIKLRWDEQRACCAICSADLNLGFHLDHKMPLARGGTNEEFNLQLLCPSCNKRKAAKHPVDFLLEMANSGELNPPAGAISVELSHLGVSDINESEWRSLLCAANDAGLVRVDFLQR